MQNECKTSLHKKFDKGTYWVGAGPIKLYSWYLLNVLCFRSGMIPFSTILVGMLRLFGASIGKDVRIKPGIYVRYPWKLVVGDHSWLADCYIDNLDFVMIGRHVCVSQQAMLMTGNHNYKLTSFDLVTNKIVLEDGVWIGARAIVTPGVKVGTHAVLTAGSTAVKNLNAYVIYQGNPALETRTRKISGSTLKAKQLKVL